MTRVGKISSELGLQSFIAAAAGWRSMLWRRYHGLGHCVTLAAPRAIVWDGEPFVIGRFYISAETVTWIPCRTNSGRNTLFFRLVAHAGISVFY